MYCPHCNHYNKRTAWECSQCGWEFGFENHSPERTPAVAETDNLCLGCGTTTAPVNADMYCAPCQERIDELDEL